MARAASPRGEVVLRRREGYDGAPVLELRVNGVFVMDTEETTSERSLARRALELVEDPAHVLVGGLGLGFTAREVLADRRVRRCTVVELEPALVEWLRDGTVPGGPDLLCDDRLELVVADVAGHVAAAAPASYDLVLLDVDNGPGYLVHAGNAPLYAAEFLGSAVRTLRAGGVLVVWSADPAPSLAQALAEVAGDAEEVRCPVRLQGREEHYHLYLARVQPGRPAVPSGP